MSRIIAGVSDKAEHEVAKTIEELEEKYGYPSHDVRLLAENIQASRQKHQELGLDPDDTTPQELYHALLARYGADCQRLDEQLGVENSTQEQKFQKAAEFIDRQLKGQEVWALKRTVAKDLLRAQPPKRLMKHLGYRSLESMLKREDIASVFMLSKRVESSTWQTQIAKLIAKQKTNCFERRVPFITAIDSYHPGDSGLVLYDQAQGSVGLALSRTNNLPALSICLLAMDGLEKLGIKLSLSKLGPELSFWTDTHSLVAWKDPEAVSLNVHDVASNHLSSASFEERSQTKGAHSLWSELMSRYGQGMQDVEETSQNLVADLKQIAGLPEPAIEYEFAEDQA